MDTLGQHFSLLKVPGDVLRIQICGEGSSGTVVVMHTVRDCGDKGYNVAFALISGVRFKSPKEIGLIVKGPQPRGEVLEEREPEDW